MTYNKYFQDELTFLAELGKEFAEANPNLAPFLGEKGNDPDVERLLEGFAFLTARLREKLDDELAELTHGLLNLLWPNYLRPLPSMSVLQFTPQPGLTERQTIPLGTEVDSIPVDGTRCRFRTCYDVDLAPIAVESVEAIRTDGGSRVDIRFSLDPRAQLDKISLSSVRLFLQGEDYITTTFFLWLFRYLASATVAAHPAVKGNEFRLPASCVTPAGFASHQALMPYPTNAFSGYRLLQEYFALPEKFLFFDVTGLGALSEFGEAQGFTLSFEFSRPLEEQTRVEKRHFALHCTPIVNLFPLDAKPVRLDHQRTEYRLLPETTAPGHYQIFDINSVEGWLSGGPEKRVYSQFESFQHAVLGTKESAIYYALRRKPAVAADSVDTYIVFVDARQESVLPPTETISVALTCSNGELAHELKVGDINRPTGSSPEFAEFRNITQPTLAMPPPLDGRLQWKLISNLALNYVSLVNLDALRELLSVYDFQALRDRQAERKARLRMEGIESIESEPAQRLFKDLPVRGRRITLRLRESRFGTEGDMFLFASVLNEFFALYSSINSFTQLIVHAIESQEIYEWPAQTGTQPIV